MQPDNLCIYCKGTRRLCGVSPCPKLQRLRVQFEFEGKVAGEKVFGPSPPNLFIGSYNYPEVLWGPMVSLEESAANDSPALLYGKGYEEIIRLRSSLVRGKKPIDVKASERMLADAQEAAMSLKTVDMEVGFTKKPVFEMRFSSLTQPMGASAPLKDLKVADNPRIPKKVDELVDDGIKAKEAICELWKDGFDNHYLTRLLSAGVLGRKEHKKLTPTRWSITALDSILANMMVDRIRDYPQTNGYFVFSNEYLHNHFEILLMPGPWEFENFEAWAPGTIWSQGEKRFKVSEEYEPFSGRWGYAEKQAGGYYATKYAVCAGLENMRRQARVVVFREIHEGYQLPVGVWAVRLTAQKAFEKKPVEFETLKETLEHLSKKLRVSVEDYIKESRILAQTRLSDF